MWYYICVEDLETNVRIVRNLYLHLVFNMSLEFTCAKNTRITECGSIAMFPSSIREQTPLRKKWTSWYPNEEKSEKYAIERKAPRKGQYPEQLSSFVKERNGNR